jgi:cytochrome c2
MRIVRPSLVAVLLLVAWMVEPAAAVLQFYKVFQAEYLDNHPDQEYAAFVKKPANRCFICHQGKVRKNHNPYGDHLVKLLDRKKDAKNKEKILAAIKQVEVLPFDPNDDQSETYADRIKAGKWPGGELEDLKQEPAE